MSESFLLATATRKEDADPELPDLSVLQISPDPPPSVDPVVGIYTSTSGKIVRRIFQGIGRNIAGEHRKPPYFKTPGGGKCYKDSTSDRGSWAFMRAEEPDAFMRARE